MKTADFREDVTKDDRQGKNVCINPAREKEVKVISNRSILIKYSPNLSIDVDITEAKKKNLKALNILSSLFSSEITIIYQNTKDSL